MYSVSFANADLVAAFKNKLLLRSFVEEIFRMEKKHLDRLQYVFCSDSYLLEMNNRFLHHDTYTDIISFDLSERNLIVGEVYISLDRVRENAATFKQPFQVELQRVIFHGALHLCGYKDKKKSEIAIMRYKEEEYLRLFEQWKRKPKPTCST